MKLIFKILILYILCIVAGQKASAQPVPAWIARFNGLLDSADVARSIAVDDSGNVYVTGYSTSLLVLSDIVTIKYSPNGTELWRNTFDGPLHLFDEGSKLVIDDSANVYVTGFSYGLLSLSDVIVIKYNTAGSLVWSARYNGSSNLADEGNSIKVDASGNVFVTGFATNGLLLPQRDFVTVKYNAAGVFQWAVNYDGPASSTDEAEDIALDNAGNIFVTGASRSGLLGSNVDYATIKYSNTGSQVWERRYDGPGNNEDRSYAIVVDNSDNVYVTGSSRSTSSAGSEDYEVVKYNNAGTQVWERRYNGPGNNEDRSYAIVVDNSDNVIITGESMGSSSNFDYATVKYDSAGTMQWPSRYNGPGNSEDRSYAIVVDNSDNVYVTGSSRSASSAGSEDYATVIYSPGGSQLWALRYDGTGNNEDRSYAIVVDNSDYFYITGSSRNSSVVGSEDYLTIKYTPLTGLTVVSEKSPVSFEISQNYPNPFNPNTNINLEIPAQTDVKIEVFDIKGSKTEILINQKLNPGTYRINWNASNYPSGVYFYKMTAGNTVITKKMIFIK